MQATYKPVNSRIQIQQMLVSVMERKLEIKSTPRGEKQPKFSSTYGGTRFMYVTKVNFSGILRSRPKHTSFLHVEYLT